MHSGLRVDPLARQPDHFHCSASDTGSFVDPVSNLTVLSGIRVDEHFATLLQGKLPVEFSTVFLHEATHHWCFSSPLGAALAMLRLRARREAVRASDGAPSDSLQALDDYQRFKTTLELLRPLAEGLAVFAEFDIFPSDVDFVCSPVSWLLFYFEPRTSGESPGDIDDVLRSALARARLSGECIARKEHLLAGDVTAGRSCHLLGYLAVKVLWARARVQSRMAQSGDVFLSYLRSYFYEDFALIAHLLDQETMLDAAINNVARHFQDRLRDLITLDWEKCLQEFVATPTKRLMFSTRDLGPSDLLGTRPGGILEVNDLGDRGRELFTQTWKSTYDDDPGDTPTEALIRWHHTWTIAKREVLCITSVACDVRVNEHGRAIAARPGPEHEIRRLIASFPALPRISPGSAPGEIGLYLLPYRSARLIVITRGSETVACQIEPDLGAVAGDQIVKYAAARIGDIEQQRVLDSILTEYIVSDSRLQSIAQHLEEGSLDAIQGLYLRYASLLTSDSKWEVLTAALSTVHLWGVLAEDATTVRGLAVLGLATSVGLTQRQTAEEILRSVNVDLAWLLRQLEAAEDRTGFVSFTEEDDHIICLV